MKPHRPSDEPPSSDRPRAGENQGEGDRASARRYNEHVRQFVARGEAGRAAEDARDALEGPEGPDLRHAEEEGARAATMTPSERATAALNRARNGLARILSALADRVAVHGHARPDGSRP